VNEALDASRLHEQGLSPAEIGAAIDRKYGRS
jgi:hypothetical protein